MASKIMPTEAGLRGAFAAAGKIIRDTLLDVSPGNWSPEKAQRARLRVDAVISSLRAQSMSWVRQAMSSAYDNARDTAAGRFAILGTPLPENRRKIIERRSKKLDRLGKLTFSDLHGAIESMVDLSRRYLSIVAQASKAATELKAMTPEAEKRVNKLTQQAIDEEWSPDKLKREVASYLSRQLDENGLIKAGGRHYEPGYYAEMVAGARLREAASLGTIEACRQYDHDLVRIMVGDDACDECADLRGQIFSISGDSEKYDPLTDEVTPGIHPSCRCYLRPVTAEEA